MKKLTIKKSRRKSTKKNYPLEKIKEHLYENNACYVLLTCSNPTTEGNMDVEVYYEGDECIASYLVDSAQGILLDKIVQSEDSY